MPPDNDDTQERVLNTLRSSAGPSGAEITNDERKLFDEALSMLVGLNDRKNHALNKVINVYHPQFPELVELLPNPEAYVKVANCIRQKAKVDPVTQNEISVIVEKTLGDMAPKIKTMTCANIVARITRVINSREQQPQPSEEFDSAVAAALLSIQKSQIIDGYLQLWIPAYHPKLYEILGTRAIDFLVLQKTIPASSLTADLIVDEHAFILEDSSMYEDAFRSSQLGNTWNRKDTLTKIAKTIMRTVTEKRSRDTEDDFSQEQRIKELKKADRELGISDKDFKRLRSKWSPRNKLLKARQAIENTSELSKRVRGRLVRVTTSATTYDLAMVEKWVSDKSTPSNRQTIAVNFGLKEITIPVSKVSNTLFTPNEVSAVFLQFYALQNTTQVDDDEEEWTPAAYTSNVIKIDVPKSQPESNQLPFPKNMLVVASRLVAAPHLNGQRARVTGKKKNDRVIVYFISAKEEKALKPINLDPVPPEEDPLQQAFLPKERSAYYNTSDSQLRSWCGRVGCYVPAELVTDQIAGLLVDFLGVLPDDTT